MKRLAIIDYGAGNLRSLQYTLERLEVQLVITDDAQLIQEADLVVFPGVGHATQAMSRLRETALHTLIPTLTQPVLGICLGMQLMCQDTEEGEEKGLGIFRSRVTKFTDTPKLPHMGWNTIEQDKNPLFEQIDPAGYVYFVHSYKADISVDTIAHCDYGSPFSAALQRDNFYATQFHPEKSGLVGLQILKNFIQLS